MRKVFMLSFFVVSVQLVFAQQSSLPEVPKRIDFAGVSVNLDAEAQKLVQKEVSALLIPENKFVQDKLQRIQWYFPAIERILEQERVPDDFKYLAVVESSLLPDAVSSSNAVGFWQMKAATAQELGLRVDGDIDERKNIYASTRAAATYLKRNNLIYKNWVSSLYSYMLGAGGISKIVPSEWTNAASVEFDSRTDRYLIKTVAARVAFEYRLNRMKQNEFALIEYRKGKGKTLAQIATAFEVDAAELKKHNSWLQVNTIPDDYPVALLVPVKKMDAVQSKIGSQPAVAASKGSKASKEEIKHRDYPVLVRVTKQTSNEEDPIFYEINEKKGILAKPGDDVASLAKAGKLKIKDFLLFNDMTDADVVDIGKVYYLQRKYTKGPVEKHEMQAGETMWEVAHAFGIQIKSLLKLNRMRAGTDVAEGQVVFLQKKRPKSMPVEIRKENREMEVAPQKNLPIMEKYEKVAETSPEVVTKKEESQKKAPQTEDTKQLPSETVVIERPRRPAQGQSQPPVQPPAQTPTIDEDDTATEPLAEEKTTLPKEEKNIPPKEEKKPQAKPEETARTREEKINPSREEKKPQVKPEETVRNKEEKTSVSKEEKKTQGREDKTTVPPANNAPKESDDIDIVVIEADEDADKTDNTRPNRNPNVTISNSSEKENTKTTGSAPKKQYHKVEPGQNLHSIARRYGLTVRELANMNDIPTTERVRIGQRLVVGGLTKASDNTTANAGDNNSSKEEKRSETKTSTTTRHRVVKGETLFSISRHYGVSMKQIQEWNNMRDRNVKIGQRLIIKKD